jgi:hypothetical protein
VVGPSPRSGEAVIPPRSRLSPSPGVGRGGDRRPRSRLSLSPGVGRGVAPEASEEWFDSSEVLALFVTPRSVWLFPHANWSLPGCIVRFQVIGLVC